MSNGHHCYDQGWRAFGEMSDIFSAHEAMILETKLGACKGWMAGYREHRQAHAEWWGDQ